ncbi:hypothetical protein D3C76_1321380 [compost metagenome]
MKNLPSKKGRSSGRPWYTNNNSRMIAANRPAALAKSHAGASPGMGITKKIRMNGSAVNSASRSTKPNMVHSIDLMGVSIGC